MLQEASHEDEIEIPSRSLPSAWYQVSLIMRTPKPGVEISVLKDLSKGNQDSRRRDAWNTGNKDKENGRRSGKQRASKAFGALDG
ncbi:hypothetical protein Tco_0775998 [Tanacetum coccineum]